MTEVSTADAVTDEASGLWHGDAGELPDRTRRVLLRLVRGPYLSGAREAQLWAVLLSDEAVVRSRLADLFLELVVDRDNELAFVRNAPADAPKAVRSEALTFLDTAMLLVLRQLLSEEGRGRVIVGPTEVFEQLAVFRTADRDEKDFASRLNSSWNKMQNKLRVLHGVGDDRAEISPVLPRRRAAGSGFPHLRRPARHRGRPEHGRRATPAEGRRSLVHRVTVGDGPFAAFVRRRIASEYDYACVQHSDDLDEVDRGVTIGGLVKRNARRYEKDDRSDVGDATRWMLGGDTDARLVALLERRRSAEAAERASAEADSRADAERQSALTRRDVFRRVATFTWERVDVASASALTAARRAELHSLTSESSSLREAQDTAERARQRLADAEEHHRRALGAHAIARDALDRVLAQIGELESTPVAPPDDGVLRALEARFRSEKRSLTLETVDAVARAVQSSLSKEKDAAARRAADAEADFAGRAAEFRHTWSAASAELTADIGDRYGYRELREGILARGLPEKEGEFRRLLRERSQDVVAHLLSDLRDAPGLIRERILPVNASLGRSPFEGTDRFLEIDVKTTRSPEVDDFLTDLRRIVEGNWSDESAAGAEQRFAVLQRVIGRLGSKDRVDVDWRTRVLDTRLHVSFLAREKDPTGRVARVYDSAEGLSGWQRQKLVIFCLGAALRYQLTEEEDDVPRFGSIVLDEAFDKADSRYTRNAMDVFRAFGFHMILATPQKLLQTLEPYVGAITSVSNPDRNASRLANVVFSAGRPEAAVAAQEETRA